MSRRKSKEPESQVEREHGHCADVLMSDFGIPKEMRKEVCEEVAKVWVQVTMIHCLIISSVRNYQPNAATRGLEGFLQDHATHEQKHRKRDAWEIPRQSGYYDSSGCYHQRESDDDF